MHWWHACWAAVNQLLISSHTASEKCSSMFCKTNSVCKSMYNIVPQCLEHDSCLLSATTSITATYAKKGLQQDSAYLLQQAKRGGPVSHDRLGRLDSSYKLL